MATAVPLDYGTTVPLNANGYGYVRIGPSGEKWEITHMHVEVSSRVSEAVCKVYRGQIASNRVVEGTYSGSTGDTSDTKHYLEDGSGLFIEWTGGDANATATVTVSGWKSVPDGGFRAVH